MDGVLPLDGTPHRLAVGTRRIDRERWLLGTGPDAAADLALRSRLLADHEAEIVVMADGADDACAEVLAAVEDHAGVDRSGLRGRAALARVAVTVTDDVVLVDGATGLVIAGVVAFPNRWRIADKLGLPVLAVHEPVPGYDAALGAPVDKLLAALRPGVYLERANWALLDDPALFQPDPKPVGAVTDPGTQVWARVERQSLTRLPQSGAVVFTIHTSQHRLDALGPLDRRHLAVVLETVPDDTAAYKAVTELRGPVLAWLRSAG